MPIFSPSFPLESWEEDLPETLSEQSKTFLRKIQDLRFYKSVSGLEDLTQASEEVGSNLDFLLFCKGKVVDLRSAMRPLVNDIKEVSDIFSQIKEGKLKEGKIFSREISLLNLHLGESLVSEYYYAFVLFDFCTRLRVIVSD